MVGNGGMKAFSVRRNPSRRNPPICDNLRCLYGEAVFNLEVKKPTGVFLLGGLGVTTLGNGVFLHDIHLTYHSAPFEKLARTLLLLQMQNDEVISWAPGTISTSALGAKSVDHSRIIVPFVTMEHWISQPYTTTFQRSFFQGTRLRGDAVEPRAGIVRDYQVLGSSVYYQAHLAVRDVYTWLQTNALATSLVMLETRMETMKSPPSLDFEGHKGVKHPSCLAVVIHAVFIGRFGTALNIRICDLVFFVLQKIHSGFNRERSQTIWPNNGLFEATKDESLVAHKRFLDSLFNEDFTLGTLQGPMLPSRRLSRYVWEHTKTVHLVLSRHLPTGRPQAWWAALNLPRPAAQASTTHLNPENSEITPTRQWPTSVTLLPGAVIRIHSLKTATHLNGRVVINLFRDNISNRLAVTLQNFRAFSGAIVTFEGSIFSFPGGDNLLRSGTNGLCAALSNGPDGLRYASGFKIILACGVQVLACGEQKSLPAAQTHPPASHKKLHLGIYQ